MQFRTLNKNLHSLGFKKNAYRRMCNIVHVKTSGITQIFKGHDIKNGLVCDALEGQNLDMSTPNRESPESFQTGSSVT